MEEHELLTPQEVVDWYRLASRQVLYQWKLKGYGPSPIRMGKHLRYPRAECERFLLEQTEPKRAS